MEVISDATPLLGSETDTRSSTTHRDGPDVHSRATPLPTRQVAVISYAGLIEPITVTFIYPFVNQMLSTMSSSPEQVAHRSGILFGFYSFAQFCCVFLWGMLSDRIGRKPVLLSCLAFGAVSTTAFGLSTSFQQLLVTRFFAGASYGDVPVLRSAMGDVTDSSNQARAFSFIPLAWAIGSTLAPLLGGFLSNPAKRYPRRFGGSEFFKQYPYALPCFTAALLSVSAFLLIAVAFTETLLPATEHNKLDQALGPRYGMSSSTVSSSSTPETNPSAILPTIPQRPSALLLLRDPKVHMVLISYGFLSLISTANDVIFALWMFLPIDKGGVGFSPAQIATTLSIGSILSTLSIVFLFPMSHRRFGTLRVYRSAMALDVVLIMLYPVVHLVASRAQPATTQIRNFDSLEWDTNVPVPVVSGILFMLVVKALASLTWGCNMILVTAAAPSSASLGTINSLAQMVASFARALGPPIYSSVFAVSMGSGVLGGKGLIWLFMGSVGMVSLSISFAVQEGYQEWREAVRVHIDLEESVS